MPMMTAMASHLSMPMLSLPPAYTLVVSHQPGNAFTDACRRAQDSRAQDSGAGTLVWVRQPDIVEFAVVLEPEEPLRTARLAFFAGMTALADAVASVCPPEKRVSFDWPDTIRFDGARLGGGRLGWPETCREDDVPPWLVFSAMLIGSKGRAGDSGLTPGSTSLEEECCDIEDHGGFVECFARCFLRGLASWSYQGLDSLAGHYLAKLSSHGPSDRVTLSENGDLLIRYAIATEIERLELVQALRSPVWLDPVSERPRL
jgi:Biotin/lipoate A/B protein ligase family